MSILADSGTRAVVHGITGHAGALHARLMLGYGTQVVAGVTPGKGGTIFEAEGEGWRARVPIFDTAARAVAETGATASVIFVPAASAADAVLEAADAGAALIVCITEGIPALEAARMREIVRRAGARLIGPNSPGVITPGESNLGITPGAITAPGRVGLVSRSGTLTYEALWQLTGLGLGQSTAVGIGGDPVVGLKYIELLELFKTDPGTEAVILIGEIGGTAEDEAAAYIRASFPKPVVGFIAGQTAPPGRRMGHAGAIIAGGKGTAREKMDALRAAGVWVAVSPADIGAKLREALTRGA